MTDPLDDHLQLLADVQRRRVLVALLDRPAGDGVDPVAGVRGSASVMANGDAAGVGSGVDTSRTGRTDEDHVWTELRHVHLPKLHAAGLVDWNRDAGTVARGRRFDEVAPLVRLLREHDDDLPGRVV